jgi:hypothetical protein
MHIARVMDKFLFLIIPFLLLSCTSEKPAAVSKPYGAESGNGADSAQLPASTGGAYTLEIIPLEPTRNSTLNLMARGFELSEATVTWLVNDSILSGAGQNNITASKAKRGDMIHARAIFHDQEIHSNRVQIRNTPPEIRSVRLFPEVFKPGDMLGVDVVPFDIDDDPVTSLYEWTKNGQPAGTSKNMEQPLHRGDAIEVTITPFDGTDYGVPVILQREIRNMPPIIVEHKEFSFDNTVYAYQVKASDPDGDTLTYSLQSSPVDMTIDPSTGLLKWIVPREFTGKKSVLVVVSDEKGGTAKYSIEISIQSQSSTTNSL